MKVPSGHRRKANEVLVENAERWADDGWGGVVGVFDDDLAIFQGFSPSLSLEEAKESLKPLSDYFESVSTPSNPFTPRFEIVGSHWELQNHPDLVGFVAANAGMSKAMASRLILRDNVRTQEKREELVDVLVLKGWSALLAAPTAFKLPESDLPGGPGQAAVTPVWREAIWHFDLANLFDPADPVATEPENLAQLFTKATTDMDRMRDITPNSGAYLNEADPYEPNHTRSFWGDENYERLLKIKRQLDPDNLLSCFRCVGYDASDARHRCYPELDIERIASR
jgi:hypothetical protein